MKHKLVTKRASLWIGLGLLVAGVALGPGLARERPAGDERLGAESGGEANSARVPLFEAPLEGPREIHLPQGSQPLSSRRVRRLPAVAEGQVPGGPLPLVLPLRSPLARKAVHLADPAHPLQRNQFAVAELSPTDEPDTVRRVGQEEDLPPPPSSQVKLHLNEINVRQALEILSRSHSLNILVAPGVSGQVTANLEGLSVDQALNAILKLCNLVAHRENDLIFVYSPEEYPKNDTRVGVFRLDYTSAADVMPVVQAMLTPLGQAFVTEVDAADNRRTQEAVVVNDAPWILPRVDDYVQQMDIPPRQVMIEAHVLQISLSDDCRHGVDYRYAIAASGSTLEFDITGFADPMASPAIFARFDGSRLDSLLHILKTTTDSKTLASPRLMVINGQKARIQVGDQLGYKVVTVTETAAVEEVKFLEVGVVLEVTPRISRDGRIVMRVKPEVSDGVINPDTELPEEETSELETDVMLLDGQGVVIGGLIQEKDVLISQKVPVLGDLHIIGRLFQLRQHKRERSEILITLVPRVCGPDLPITERDLFDVMRTETPIFCGPLCPAPRPWLPQPPDAIRNPHHLIQHPHCQRCNSVPCLCTDVHGAAQTNPIESPPPSLPLFPPADSFPPTVSPVDYR